MLNNNKIVSLLLIIYTVCFGCIELDAAFSSPTKKQIAFTPISEMEKLLSVRKITPDKAFLDKIVQKEKVGFIGYHGDCLDFMIYQDIIRWVLEMIVELPVREDFHFLAVPLDPLLTIHSKDELTPIFNSSIHPERDLNETTFPLNFTLWDNANRLGLNSIEHFTKNEPVRPLGYKKRLVWLFTKLGIEEQAINKLFDAAYTKLNNDSGIILQIFGDKNYSFAKKIAYPSYQNGFISSNVTVDEYFLDDEFLPPYPHEVRLLLNNEETLNPNNSLKIERFISEKNQSKISDYKQLMRKEIEQLSFDQNNASEYKVELQNAWK